VDTKRFIDKIGMLDKEKFAEMKKAVKDLLWRHFFCSPTEVGEAEAICTSIVT
jgi:hypothetical protein